MTWLLLALGFFLVMSGILGQAYSLKTKRGVAPESRIWRVLTRANAVPGGVAADSYGGGADRYPSRGQSLIERTIATPGPDTDGRISLIGQAFRHLVLRLPAL